MKILDERWISYHKCPHCKSTLTYHSFAMEKLDMSKYGNVWAIQVRKNHANPDDVTLEKYDLCYNCGQNWLMYIQRIDMEGEKAELSTPKSVGAPLKKKKAKK